jgi:hypothetical protein
VSPVHFSNYCKRLTVAQAESILDSEDAKAVRMTHKSYLEDELRKASTYVPSASKLSDQWHGMVWPANKEAVWDPETGLSDAVLRRVGEASVTMPPDFVRYILRSQNIEDLRYFVCRNCTPGCRGMSLSGCKALPVAKRSIGRQLRCFCFLYIYMNNYLLPGDGIRLAYARGF